MVSSIDAVSVFLKILISEPPIKLIDSIVYILPGIDLEMLPKTPISADNRNCCVEGCWAFSSNNNASKSRDISACNGKKTTVARDQ